MNGNTKNCPICPRGCDLSAPHCGRGEEYAKTGNISQDREHGRRHGHSPRLSFEKKEQQLVMKYLHHAVNASDNGGFTQEQTGDMFSVLTDEETACLAGLLEKLSDHWMKIAPTKPSHHGKQ